MHYESYAGPDPESFHEPNSPVATVQVYSLILDGCDWALPWVPSAGPARRACLCAHTVSGAAERATASQHQAEE